MSLLDQLNVVNCKGSAVKGTGRKACPFDWNRIETIEFSETGFRYEDEQNLAYIQEQQQLGKLIVCRGIKSFTLQPVDPNVNTAEGSGYETVTGEMPYKYNVVFDNGVNFWKALRTLNSKDQYNVALYDVEGNKIFTQTKSGAVKGFGLKMLFTGQYKGKEGGNPAEYTTVMQFSDLMEMERQTWVSADNLDYDPTDIDGINDVEIVIAPVAAAATTLVFSPYLNDNSHILLGTAVANFRFKKNGAPITPTGLVTDENAKTITVTIPATVAAEVYTIETWDPTLATNTILLLDNQYRSEVATVTVV